MCCSPRGAPPGGWSCSPCTCWLAVPSRSALHPILPKAVEKGVPKHVLGVRVDEVQPLPAAVLALSGVPVDSVRQSWVGACAQQDPVTRKGCARPRCRYPARARGSEPAISLSQTDQGFRSKKALWAGPKRCPELARICQVEFSVRLGQLSCSAPESPPGQVCVGRPQIPRNSCPSEPIKMSLEALSHEEIQNRHPTNKSAFDMCYTPAWFIKSCCVFDSRHL